MTTDTTPLPRFRVYVEPADRDIVWWADTDAVAGLSLAAPTLVQLRALIEEAAQHHLGTSDVALELVIDAGPEVEADNVPSLSPETTDRLPVGTQVRATLIPVPVAAA